MQALTPSQQTEWKAIKHEICQAYRNVTLGDGIGYYEAGAREFGFEPTDPEYIEAKAKDERENWTWLLIDFEDEDPEYNNAFFMDARGLLFYLPFLMIKRSDSLNGILHFYIGEYFKREDYTESPFTKTVELMTKAQKHCVFRFYQFWTRIEHSEFWEEHFRRLYCTKEKELWDFNFMKFVEERFCGE